MARKPSHLIVAVLACVPFVGVARQDPAQKEPLAEEVFKDVRVFKGVPARDMIPAMEFMSASLKKPCTYCHEKDDYAAETQGKEVGRRMVLLQRDINDKWFEGRLSVTCQSCHMGEEHPATVPIPTDTKLRHQRYQTALKPEDFFKKHLDAVGAEPVVVKRTGTLTIPGETADDKPTESPSELIQARGGKFRATGYGAFGSDGKQVWKDTYPLADEPAAIFSRLGRDWRGEDAFAGLERLFVSGKDKVGDVETVVIRGTRKAMSATEELYFDMNTGLLVRMTNITPSTIGSVVSVYDYKDYKEVNGVKVPMTVIATFPDDKKWTFTFTAAETGTTVDDKQFSMPGG